MGARAGGAEDPQKEPKKGRLWLNDGSRVRRPGCSNHVWSFDFVEDRTHNGRRFRMLKIIDEFTRERLAAARPRLLVEEGRAFGSSRSSKPQKSGLAKTFVEQNDVVGKPFASSNL
jgi:hypothetical protein